MSAIPTIDIVSALDGEPDADMVAAIGDACEQIGFFVITGHGVDPAAIATVEDVTRRFFVLGDEHKWPLRSPSGSEFRGWTRNSKRDGMPLSLVELFEVGAFDDVDDMVAAGYDAEVAESVEPNIWPPLPSEFRAVWRSYMDTLTSLGDLLLQLCARALGLDPDWFADKFDRQPSYLGANFYPAQPLGAPDDTVRRSAHTDFGALTILHQQADRSGLEVLDRTETWRPVPPVDGGFVINLGDLFAKWTNDRWIATLHRVQNPTNEERQHSRLSLAFFQHPNLDALIECIPTCTSPGNPPKYPPVAAKDWTAFRSSQYYSPESA